MRNAGYALLLSGAILSLTNNHSIAILFHVTAAGCFFTNILNKGR